MPGWLPSGAAWGPGLVVAAACAVLGLVAERFVSRDRTAHFLGARAAIVGSAFHLAMLGVVLVAAAPEALWTYWVDSREGSIPTAVALVVVVGCGAVALTWSRLPILKRFAAASDPGSYSAGGRVSATGVVLQLLVRYPLTVVAEETVFRGYLQMHLRWGVVAASVAFAASHVMQWRTIPSLLPYAFALGMLAAWTGSIMTGAVVHYVMDAGFMLVIVLPQERREDVTATS